MANQRDTVEIELSRNFASWFVEHGKRFNDERGNRQTKRAKEDIWRAYTN